MDILIENVSVLRPDQGDVLEGQNVVVEGNRIAQVTPDPVEPGPETKTFSGQDRLLIPGLISAHSHSPENFLKARIEAVPLELWLVDLFNSSFSFSEREIYLAAMVGAIEMLKTGGTGIVDHMWVNEAMTETALDAVMRAYGDVGIRAAVAPLVEDDHRINKMILEQNPELEGGIYGSSPPINAQDYLAVLDAFFQKWHDAEGGRLRCLAGPSGPQWCSEELMTGAMEIARRYDSGFHMHAEETKLQSITCRQFFGKSSISKLEELGLLTERTSLAHCVWIDDHDIELMAQAGVTVVHNSPCNLKLGSGFAPVPELLEKGVSVALACDGAASNDNQVMFDVMKVTGLMHTVRHPNHRKWLRARQIVEMATVSGARVLQRRGELGVVEPGALADFSLIDLTTTAFTPLNDPFQHLVYCETGSSVRTVFVDGKPVVEDGELTTVDEAALLKEARECWAKRAADIPPLDEDVKQFLAAQERFQQDMRTQPFSVQRY